MHGMDAVLVIIVASYYHLQTVRDKKIVHLPVGTALIFMC